MPSRTAPARQKKTKTSPKADNRSAKKPRATPSPLVLEPAAALTGFELARRASGAKAKNLLPFVLETVEVRESGIHGLGVFAAKRIKKGAHIADMLGKRVKRNNDHVLWIETDDGDVFGLEPWNELRFTNHSKTPNAVFYGHELWALRSIEKGEEITFDYDGEVDTSER